MMLQEAMMNNSLFVKESDSQLMRVFYIAVSKKSLFVTPWTVVLHGLFVIAASVALSESVNSRGDFPK